MVRERRLTWDRAHLNAIREARHLITEGISLNPECDLLHLELAKLEINAFDFFRTRVLPRYENCGVDSANTSADINLNGCNKKKKLKTLEREAAENKKFVRCTFCKVVIQKLHLIITIDNMHKWFTMGC